MGTRGVRYSVCMHRYSSRLPSKHKPPGPEISPRSHFALPPFQQLRAAHLPGKSLQLGHTRTDRVSPVHGRAKLGYKYPFLNLTRPGFNQGPKGNTRLSQSLYYYPCVPILQILFSPAWSLHQGLFSAFLSPLQRSSKKRPAFVDPLKGNFMGADLTSYLQ